jgi:hypothetical protein
MEFTLFIAREVQDFECESEIHTCIAIADDAFYCIRSFANRILEVDVKE